MTIMNPDWLSKRGGSVGPHATGQDFIITLEGQPEYRLTPKPVAGKVGCDIVHTNNGRKIESKDVYADAHEAVRGGLEELRKTLGW